jgi:hypothetical protein
MVPNLTPTEECNNLENFVKLFHDDLNTFHALSVPKIISFVNMAASLRDDVILMQPLSHSPSEPPNILPPSIASFLAVAIEVELECIPKIWKFFKKSVWDFDASAVLGEGPQMLFRAYGY